MKKLMLAVCFVTLAALAAGDKIALTFSVDAYTAGLPQLLRVLPAADSCEGALAAVLRRGAAR